MVHEGQLLSVGDDLLFFCLQLAAMLKLQFQSGTPFLKVWIHPCKGTSQAIKSSPYFWLTLL